MFQLYLYCSYFSHIQVFIIVLWMLMYFEPTRTHISSVICDLIVKPVYLAILTSLRVFKVILLPNESFQHCIKRGFFYINL